VKKGGTTNSDPRNKADSDEINATEQIQNTNTNGVQQMRNSFKSAITEGDYNDFVQIPDYIPAGNDWQSVKFCVTKKVSDSIDANITTQREKIKKAIQDIICRKIGNELGTDNPYQTNTIINFTNNYINNYINDSMDKNIFYKNKQTIAPNTLKVVLLKSNDDKLINNVSFLLNDNKVPLKNVNIPQLYIPTHIGEVDKTEFVKFVNGIRKTMNHTLNTNSNSRTRKIKRDLISKISDKDKRTKVENSNISKLSNHTPLITPYFLQNSKPYMLSIVYDKLVPILVEIQTEFNQTFADIISYRILLFLWNVHETLFSVANENVLSNYIYNYVHNEHPYIQDRKSELKDDNII
jgi:hypothetical protein